MPAYPLRLLEEVSENYDSQRIPVKAADRKPGPYPYYGAQGIVDYVDNYIFDGEFVLVAEDGENLRTRRQDIALIASGKFWVNNHAHILRANAEANTRFLQYAINTTDISGYITGSTIPKLSQRSLSSILIPCPTPAEQDEIVSLVGALDDKIALNRRTNETLEATARAIFKDWFVDFGPTRAKADGREPYLAPEIWELFPDALDDGDKPVGWEHNFISGLADVRSGKRPPHRENKKSLTFSVPLYGGAGQIAYVANHLYESPILLTGRVGTLGIVHRIKEPSWPSDNTLIIVPRNKRHFDYIYFVLQEVDFIGLNRGSTQPLVSQTDLKKQAVVTAPHQILDQYSDLACPIMAQIDTTNQETHTLALTRDLILPKLMSGEIRLRDAEKAVEAIA